MKHLAPVALVAFVVVLGLHRVAAWSHGTGAAADGRELALIVGGVAVAASVWLARNVWRFGRVEDEDPYRLRRRRHRRDTRPGRMPGVWRAGWRQAWGLVAQDVAWACGSVARVCGPVWGRRVAGPARAAGRWWRAVYWRLMDG